MVLRSLRGQCSCAAASGLKASREGCDLYVESLEGLASVLQPTLQIPSFRDWHETTPSEQPLELKNTQSPKISITHVSLDDLTTPEFLG